MIQGSTTLYYHTATLNTVIAMAAENGAVVERYAYDAFGAVQRSGSATANPYLFTGRRQDAESGLYYYRNRMYDPAQGRFLGIDPIGYQGGPNLYSYVGNAPTLFGDPLGLMVLCPDTPGEGESIPNGVICPRPKHGGVGFFILSNGEPDRSDQSAKISSGACKKGVVVGTKAEIGGAYLGGYELGIGIAFATRGGPLSNMASKFGGLYTCVTRNKEPGNLTGRSNANAVFLWAASP